MTRSVTLRMDEGLLAELRHRAIDAHMSLSAWITTVFSENLGDEQDYGGIRVRNPFRA